jgi:hypothetical protein
VVKGTEVGGVVKTGTSYFFTVADNPNDSGLEKESYAQAPPSRPGSLGGNGLQNFPENYELYPFRNDSSSRQAVSWITMLMAVMFALTM